MIDELHEEVEDIMKRFQEIFPERTYMEETPEHEIFDEGDKYRILIFMPGVDKENINVEAGDNWIRITAAGTIASETRRYYLYRTFLEKINPDGIRARYKNGVLELEIPKLAPRGKRIPVE